MRAGIQLLSPAAATLAALLGLVAACAPSSRAGGGEHPLSGRVAAVEPGAERTRVRVESDREPRAFALLVGPRTEIVRRRADGSTEPARLADLVPGVRIDAAHTGTELRSLVPQYEATRVRILAEP